MDEASQNTTASISHNATPNVALLLDPPCLVNAPMTSLGEYDLFFLEKILSVAKKIYYATVFSGRLELPMASKPSYLLFSF